MGSSVTTFSDSPKKPKIKVDNVVFVCGMNNSNELLSNGKQAIDTLTRSNFDSSKVSIKRIQSGNELSVYSDDKGEIFRILGNIFIASPSSMQYFKTNKIKTHKVFTNICSQSIFWISNKNQVYASGIQHRHQLGVAQQTNTNIPTLIPSLHTNGNIIDIKGARFYSLALISYSNSYSNYANIIKYWTRRKNCNVSIPNDLINVMIQFYSLNELYSTGMAQYGGHCDGANKKHSWTPIEFFDNDNIMIIQISTGYYHTLCLDINGKIWCCGNNDYGQLGLGHFRTNSKMSPKSIKYLIRHKIMIKRIECGHSHNLAIDSDKRVWSWGNNEHGQCGHGTIKNVNKPKLIELFKREVKNKKVIDIGCGTWHSFAKNDRNEYYLWGSNVYQECILSEDDNRKIVKSPHCINDIVEMETGFKIIKQISLGKHNTKLVLSNS